MYTDLFSYVTVATSGESSNPGSVRVSEVSRVSKIRVRESTKQLAHSANYLANFPGSPRRVLSSNMCRWCSWKTVACGRRGRFHDKRVTLVSSASSSHHHHRRI